MRSKLGLGTVTKVSLILIVLVIVAVAGATLMASFLGKTPPTSTTSTATTSTSTSNFTTITSIRTSTTTTSSVTLKLPETRSYFPDIFDLFGNFSTMTISIKNSTNSPALNFSSTEILTYSVANLTSTASNRTAAVGFNYNYTSITNGVRESYTNVSIAFLQMGITNTTTSYSLVFSNGTLYFQQAAQVVGNELTGPFYYVMGVGLPIKSDQYTSTQSGLAQQSFANFQLPETVYSISYTSGNAASATVGDYPPSSLLLVAYDSGTGWTFTLTGAQAG
jgi:hypothetical protein